MSDTLREPMQLDVRAIPPREKHPTIFRTQKGALATIRVAGEKVTSVFQGADGSTGR